MKNYKKAICISWPCEDGTLAERTRREADCLNRQYESVQGGAGLSTDPLEGARDDDRCLTPAPGEAIAASSGEGIVRADV